MPRGWQPPRWLCPAARAAGSACVGNGFSDWLKQTFGKDSAASSESAEAAAPDAGTPDAGAASEPPAESADTSLPAYNADPLTGEPRRSNGRMVGVMVNNISNTQRQNARPQRGIGSADLLIESKVEGGISRFCAVYYDANAIPEVGPLRSGRDQFLQLLMPWQALYYHDGESAPCTKFINVYNYSGLNIGGKSYFNTPHPSPCGAPRQPRPQRGLRAHRIYLRCRDPESCRQRGYRAAIPL